MVRESTPEQARKRKWPWVVGVLLVLFVIVGLFGDKGEQPAGPAHEQPAATIPGGLTGMDAASARDRLEDLGFVVTTESVDGRTVIVESNWNVVSVSLRDKKNAVLRVAKPAVTTTSPPAPVNVPTTSDTPVPAVPEPAPQEQPTPEPAPDVYYANCAEARAAGAAPMTAGQPGYRPGLDRNKDGVACE
jgi:hypothetical protein